MLNGNSKANVSAAILVAICCEVVEISAGQVGQTISSK
jgi:hypothetical protein